MSDWTGVKPEPGTLVDELGTWRVLTETSAPVFYDMSAEVMNNTAVKLLCRAGDMATCWAELAKLPGVTRVGHMHFLSATLPGKATACPQLVMWQEGSGHIYLRADLRYFYPEDDARNDQIRQWLGALRAYIAACKGQS